MPYRRLPQTDPSRISALRCAIEMEGYKENGELVLSYQAIQTAQQFLQKFEKTVTLYQQNINQITASSKAYRKEIKNAKLYVSHFVTVMNMAIMRGELRKEIKIPYGLSMDNNLLPNLNTEADLQEWGERIIKAEEIRTGNGGVPIYNPTIAKVKVHWGIFNDHYFGQKLLRESAEKLLKEIVEMRPEADDIILDIWNQVEACYNTLPQEEKLEKCRKFGLIYYYRSNEKAQKPVVPAHPTFSFE